jgi:hypothetical protein
MKIGPYTLTLIKRTSLSGWKATSISIIAIIVALIFFSLIFLLDGVNPLLAYKEIFSYAFANSNGLPLTINRFIFLLFATYAFIIPFRAGLWNIGMTGQLYIGSLGAFAVLYAFGGKVSRSADLNLWIVIPLMILAAMAGGAAIGAIAGVLKGKYNINEIVVTMILNFIAGARGEAGRALGAILLAVAFASFLIPMEFLVRFLFLMFGVFALLAPTFGGKGAGRWILSFYSSALCPPRGGAQQAYNCSL